MGISIIYIKEQLSAGERYGKLMMIIEHNKVPIMEESTREREEKTKLTPIRNKNMKLCSLGVCG